MSVADRDALVKELVEVLDVHRVIPFDGYACGCDEVGVSALVDFAAALAHQARAVLPIIDRERKAAAVDALDNPRQAALNDVDAAIERAAECQWRRDYAEPWTPTLTPSLAAVYRDEVRDLVLAALGRES